MRRNTLATGLLGVGLALLAVSCGGGGGGGATPTISSLTAAGTQASSAPYDVPSTVRLGKSAPETFTLQGSALGVAGDTVQVTFADPSGAAIFDASGTSTVTVAGTAQGPQVVTGPLPVLTGANRLSVDVVADVQVTLASGAVVATSGLVRFVAPPTVTAIVNQRAPFDPTNPANVFSSTFLGMLATTAQVSGTSFDTAPGPNPAMQHLIYDAVAGPSTPIGPGTLGGVTVTPTLVTGTCPIDGTLTGPTPCRLRIVNRDDQYDEANGTFDVTGVVPNQNVISTAGSNAGTSIAVNPTNPLNVVVAANEMAATTPRILVARTADGGLTWTNVVVGPGLGPPAGDGLDAPTNGQMILRRDPQVVADAQGNFYLAYHIRANVAPIGNPVPFVFDGVMVFTSLDGGQTWIPLVVPPFGNGLPVFLNTEQALWPAPVPNLYQVYSYHLAVGPDAATPANTAVYVAGTHVDGTGGLSDIHAVECASVGPGGVVTTPYGYVPAQMAAPGSLGASTATVGPSGELYLFEVNLSPTGGSEIRLRGDADGIPGLTFGLNPLPGLPGPIVVSPSLPHRPVVVPAQPDLGWPCFGVGEVVPAGAPKAGRVVLAYTDVATVGPPANTRVLVLTSDTAGATWSTPQRVHTVDTNDQFHPWLTTDPKWGHVYATWSDAKDDPTSPYGAVNRYSAASVDGTSWSAALLLSQARSDESGGLDVDDFRFGSGLAVYDKVVWASWADNSDFTADNAVSGGGEGESEVYVSPYMQKP